jgi:hypothetical protein
LVGERGKFGRERKFFCEIGEFSFTSQKDNFFKPLSILTKEWLMFYFCIRIEAEIDEKDRLRYRPSNPDKKGERQ